MVEQKGGHCKRGDEDDVILWLYNVSNSLDEVGELNRLPGLKLMKLFLPTRHGLD